MGLFLVTSTRESSCRAVKIAKNPLLSGECHMKVQRRLNIATVILSIIAGGLLYIRITDYYQLSNVWVDLPDASLKNYILRLWILVGTLILSDLVWFYLRSKDLDFKTWSGFGFLIVVLLGCILQFTQTPNYKSYHETPYAISATTVEKQINVKSFDPYKNFPIYFYRKTDSAYKSVRHQIRQFSLGQQNDIPSIDLSTLEKKLGKKRYTVVLKNAKINSNSAFFMKYYDDNGDARRITFNNLQDSKNLNKAFKFMTDH